MKILLDENIPLKIKTEFAEHQLFTVREMGWHGKKNGELLGMATLNDFQVFITMDRNLQHQQNLKKFEIIIVVLKAVNNQIETLKPYMNKAFKELQKKTNSKIIEIEI